MGNSQAYPVFRTTDLAAAVETARRLLAIGDPTGVKVSLEVTVSEASELEMLSAAMPTATAFGCGQSPAIQASTSSVIASPFPIFLEWTSQPLGRLEDCFVAVAGKCPATVVWSRVGWPEVPALHLPAEEEYAHVSVSINSRQLHWDEPAPDHTVHIHDRKGGSLRAQWLADQVGLYLIGPPYLAV
ncbi:hypothetical protein [Streptomyces sp. ME19-01-6]|uniref:hypothetical protein n=1 Tax=Streptomyces sp. ME19-01-6 TaxID=3028686 RepID=UPI0029BF249F|nr:hypothetical protein [Streptomyces sp. ME19-01-6]MDX3226216.1 hypothetical protein [Streptomyces sp. ME19-01-6]